MLIIVLAVVLVVVVVGAIINYNGLIKARNRVEQADSDIDVQLKLRRNVIPNLIESVKGYMNHEKETLNAVVKARSDAMKTQPGSSDARQSENILEGTLKSLFALAENYPDLKASQNFLNLDGELKDIEEKIQASRRLYNSTLRQYIDKTQLFPSNILAGMFGFKVTGEYFEVEEAEAAPVKVSF